MPVYNGAAHLGAALESILAQSFQAFEILAVDDGSTDQSPELLENLRSQHPSRLRVLHHRDGRNHGIVATYELGISRARGEYVAFLEQDDAWTPNYLEGKVARFEDHPCVGVVFSPYRVVADGLFGREMTLRQWLLRWRIPDDGPFSDFRDLIKVNNVGSFSCFVARKESLERIRAPVDRSIVYYDWWVLLSLSMQTQFAYDADSFCYWRHCRASVLGRQSWPEHCGRGLAFFKSLYDFLDRHADQLDPDLRRQYLAHRRYVPKFLQFFARRNLSTLCKLLLRNPAWAISTSASLMVNYFKFLISKAT